jgi:hypothetical protein
LYLSQVSNKSAGLNDLVVYEEYLAILMKQRHKTFLHNQLHAHETKLKAKLAEQHRIEKEAKDALEAAGKSESQKEEILGAKNSIETISIDSKAPELPQAVDVNSDLQAKTDKTIKDL